MTTHNEDYHTWLLENEITFSDSVSAGDYTGWTSTIDSDGEKIFIKNFKNPYKWFQDDPFEDEFIIN